jgi:uncharacterized repeat protein (TIGR01451 family)
MKGALSRALLFVVGLALLIWSLLPARAGLVMAGPPLLITQTATAEPPTRTATPGPPPSATATPAAPPSATATAAPPGSSPTATAVPPGSSPTATATVAVPTDAPTIPPNSSDNPSATPPPAATATVTVTPPALIADPQISKSVNRSVVQVGDVVEFSISVTNVGNAPASDVVAEDSLPSFLAFDGVAVTRGEVSVSGATVRVLIGTLAPGETVTITITARVVALAVPPNNSNLASVATSSDTDNPGNDTSSVSLTTEEQPTAAPAAPPSLPNTGGPGEAGPLGLAALGLALIAASMLARRGARRR